MSELYRPDSRTLNPRRRLAARPGDGQPKPTGYYPDLIGERARDYVTASEVVDYSHRPARAERGDRAVAVDQHPWLQVDQMWTPPQQGDRKTGQDDPAADGPPAPTVRLLQMFLTRARGTSATRFLDVPGRKFPTNGSQDGVSWTYYQDPRTAMMPLQSDGTAPDSLHALPPSAARGWSVRPAVNATETELRKSGALRQQKRPHQDRLAPATAAGQTYSQRTAQTGEGLQRAGMIGSRRSRG